ncbi:hypothetical protein M011DRAFT_398375 [Sporormia fimetaria CBS 119925]|uniref:Uncharacterized protein n=1 Tax=Sporormia fimetaria CBS 119925 TaxID=1340428 RepID=A0A6A6VJA1_9PLEO|nr:hypothetical protein M011DRAFT_398375 [Sporormia fimetaria CBS 119925]
MSFSYDRYHRQQPAQRRTAFGYWVPLVLTVTVATAGLAAWVWSERRDADDESSDDADLSYGEERDGKAAVTTHGERAQHDDGLVSRVQGVIRRTPSPQQLFDSVSKKTVAGVAAAGAAAGAVLASIREEDRTDRDDFGDHSRWSEEAALRRQVEAQSSQSAAAVETQTKSFAASMRTGAQSSVRRKTVAVVVSADAPLDGSHEIEGSYRSENATLLSLLQDTETAKVKLFVLIYTPSMRSRPSSGLGHASLTSSYSAISTPVHTPGEELKSMDAEADEGVYTPATSIRGSDSSLYKTLHSQALRLVDTPAMVMPFTTPTGHVHMLRHIAPDIVYVVDALSGPNGANIEDLKRWVGQTVVVVDSDGTGLGALVDTDDEGPASKAKVSEHGHLGSGHWWEKADMVGLGKGVEIVDASRFGDDFERRAGGRE